MNKKIFSSTSNSLFILQIISFLISIIGYFFIEFTWFYFILSVSFYYIYSILGISMMLHRFYTHKNFKLNSIIKWFLTIFAILSARGSILGWVYIHRIHHATADTIKDPHSPFFNFRFIGFRPYYENKKPINYFIVKDLLTPTHIFIDKYYLLILFLFLFLLGTINFNLLFYIWALPIFFVSITQTLFNYYAHKYGYRNFISRDRSTNNMWLWLFVLGDAWHNNHHYSPEKLSTKVRWFEFDPIVSIIKLIRKNNV